MKRTISLSLLLILLLLPTVSAAYIADYPYFFISDDKFKAIYVIGDEAPSKDVVSATMLSTALAKYPNVTTEIGTSRVASQISDIKQHNAIVIGTPCENEAAAALQGNPTPCDKNLAASAGHIRLYEFNGKYQLLITGISADDRRQAAKFLANQPLSALTTRTHIIPTNTGSTPGYFSRKNTKNNGQPVIITQQANDGESFGEENVTRSDEKNDQSTQVQTSNTKSSQEPGEYQPLTSVPKKRGFFAKIWSIIKAMFT